MLHRILLLLLLGTAFTIFSCKKEPVYEQMVKKELASGVRNDSLFLGYKLGMPRDEFYNYSWELNKQKLVREGPQNQSVEYDLDDALPHPAAMNFYPDFKDQKIYRMRVSFSYDGWAPWNKHLSSDSLLLDVKDLMEQWYGAGFIRMQRPETGTNFVKIDGNREILIFKKDDIVVNVFFTDLAAIKEDANTE